ncbi:probable malonyl-CoA-acyl carrier protein transacylase, mitochondrial [Ornithodoros turicata]|uniref:probable malonyl-CoA-acyl carrier protein transacylase, mitochondrial n=1 Tax=Ornithodoros turicata TaxID=34597 RepID=UPI003139890D
MALRSSFRIAFASVTAFPLELRTSSSLLARCRSSRSIHTSTLCNGKGNKDGNGDSLDMTTPKKIYKENVPDLFRRSASFDSDTPKRVDDVWSTPTYPVEFKIPEEEKEPQPVRIDPKDTSVLLFPGQGAQFVGMGVQLLEYPNVKEMYERASEILKYDLQRLCIEGPKFELSQTVHCQAAVLVTSLAAVEKLKELQPWAIENCVATAGFSVGEYAALVFSRAISFEDAVRLVKIRGEAMQAASELEPSGMMTVFLLPTAKPNYICHLAREWCARQGKDNPVCSVANYLFANCKVIAGHEEALQFIEVNARDLGIKKYKKLSVSGAFHTSLMAPAQKALAKALHAVHIDSPRIATHSNVDGEAYWSDPDEIRRRLEKQVVHPVKWEQLLHNIYAREDGEAYPRTFECGPGNSLRAILKVVNGKAWNISEGVDV